MVEDIRNRSDERLREIAVWARLSGRKYSLKFNCRQCQSWGISTDVEDAITFRHDHSHGWPIGSDVCPVDIEDTEEPPSWEDYKWKPITLK
jgi:hypothetical protein